ncbi:MAG: GTP pyrophosphokinase family protein [Lachnospirales bacterium]
MKIKHTDSEINNFRFGADMLKKNDDEILAAIRYMVDLNQIYSAAIKEISTKLEILDNEFSVRYDHNPIHHIESRLKKPYSILEKLERKGFEKNIEAATDHLNDIAGIRVICNYIKDIYDVADFLLRQDDVTLINRKDYIEEPKANGYRSLHIVVTVPVFLSTETKLVPVEVQLRTIAMDFWASLEHKLEYKSKNEDKEDIRIELLECAKSASELDIKMQNLYFKIHENDN